MDEGINKKYFDAINLLHEFNMQSPHIVDGVKRREEINSALDVLSELDEILVLRWSLQDYG